MKSTQEPLYTCFSWTMTNLNFLTQLVHLAVCAVEVTRTILNSASSGLLPSLFHRPFFPRTLSKCFQFGLQVPCRVISYVKQIRWEKAKGRSFQLQKLLYLFSYFSFIGHYLLYLLKLGGKRWLAQKGIWRNRKQPLTFQTINWFLVLINTEWPSLCATRPVNN